MLCKQITLFMDQFFSKYQCGFIKEFSVQDCFLAKLGKWKRNVDKGNVSGSLLTDLSKAFDCLSDELIIAKLSVYRISLPALKLTRSCLSNRLQTANINNSNSSLGVKYSSVYLKVQY